jgi:formylglycine-generating enzyme required for sulfatase activity
MPVINVSWGDAKQYVGWLSQLTGKEYRLLTEAEWEYAARAGANTRYSWGDDPGMGNANCDGCGSQWDLQQTAPVGSFKPNALGLYDMHGNVWEWVEDSWHENYDSAPTDGSAWLRGGKPSYRVVRGGSWRPFHPLLVLARLAKATSELPRPPPAHARLHFGHPLPRSGWLRSSMANVEKVGILPRL